VLTPLGIRTYFKPLTTLRNTLTHVKDPVPPDERKGVVYCVPCDDCRATYVGQTGRTMIHHLKEHKRAVPNHSQPQELCPGRTCYEHWP